MCQEECRESTSTAKGSPGLKGQVKASVLTVMTALATLLTVMTALAN